MGIPKYHQWMTTRYPTAFAENEGDQADHVYVDINAFFHDVMRHATGRDGFFQHLFSKIDNLVRNVVPSLTLYLAVDGPASCAKCLTQRTRRRLHADKDSKSGGKKDKGKGKGKVKGKWKQQKGPEEHMSNNMLTPGVPFMTDITAALEYYAASRMKPGQLLGHCKAVTVSGANAVGEGEHKIVTQMLRHATCGGADESHVIISGDADVFLLSLVQGRCRRVRVVSERQQQPGMKRGRGMALSVWNAEALSKSVLNELSTLQLVGADECAVRRDFALVSLLAGNDYLPPLKCGAETQKLWTRYIALRTSKFQADSLIVAEPADDIYPPSHQENGWAAACGDAGACFDAEPYERLRFHAALMTELMRTASNGAPARSGGRSAEGVKTYLRGLLWIMEMYRHGYCGDFYFVFEKELHQFASASLIVQHMPGITAEGDLVAPCSGEPPMRPISCALCILPVNSARQYVCETAPTLDEMLQEDHPLMGEVVAREQSTGLKDCRVQLASLQAQLQQARSMGQDDTNLKRSITQQNERMQQLKVGAGGDIDTVPLWEVDAEVRERCADLGLPTLEFASDVTVLRNDQASGGTAASVPAPSWGMQPAQLRGLLRIDGEWPASDLARRAGTTTESYDLTAQQQGEEWQEEAAPDGGELAVAAGGDIEVEIEDFAEAEEEFADVQEPAPEADAEYPDDWAEEPQTDEAWWREQEFGPPAKRQRTAAPAGIPAATRVIPPRQAVPTQAALRRGGRPAAGAPLENDNPVGLLASIVEKAPQRFLAMPEFTFTQQTNRWVCVTTVPTATGQLRATGNGTSKILAKRLAAQGLLRQV